jgi:hypothetical protein
MAAGGFVRLGYRLAAFFAPRLVAGRLAAPEVDSVMNMRGFGGQHIAIAVFTLLSARSAGLARPALLLNIGIEVCDVGAGALEVRERGTRDPIARGCSPIALRGLDHLGHGASHARPLRPGGQAVVMSTEPACCSARGAAESVCCQFPSPARPATRGG